MAEWFNNIKDQFILNFIKENRWKLLLEGLGTTLEITLVAVCIGIALGLVLAIIRSFYAKNGEHMHGLPKAILKILNALANVYLTVIRGTPVVVQLMIIYYVVFESSKNKLGVAILAFGLNSAAYVAEIFRSGIMSIDQGQFEAGRSMGLNFVQTMTNIILPQAFKNVLPALANEVIVLFKETSVAGYVAIMDLTRAGNIIRGRTYSAFMPLIAVALIYLVIVVVLTKLVSILERRLRASEH